MTNKPLYLLLFPACALAAFTAKEIDTAAAHHPEYSLLNVYQPIQHPVDTPKVKTASREDNIIFEKVEVPAAFAGGIDAWRKFLVTNTNPNIPISNGAPGGNYTVIIRFMVNREGKLSDFTAVTNHGFGMEQECLRVMKLPQQWTAAVQNGRTVNSYVDQKFTFMVPEDNAPKKTQEDKKKNN